MKLESPAFRRGRMSKACYPAVCVELVSDVFGKTSLANKAIAVIVRCVKIIVWSAFRYLATHTTQAIFIPSVMVERFDYIHLKSP